MTEPMPVDAPIVARLVAVMADVGAVGRNAQMEHGERYRYRRNDDVLSAVQPALVRHGVVAVPEVVAVKYRDRTTRNGNPQVWCSLTVRWTFHGAAGDSVSAVVVGEASDTSDKATNKAHTASQKIALCQVLSIPYSQDDPDDDRQQLGHSPQGARSGRQRAGGGGNPPGRQRQHSGRSSGQPGDGGGTQPPPLPPVPGSTEAVEVEWEQAGDRDRGDAERLQARLDGLRPELTAAACARMSTRANGFPVRDVYSLTPAWLSVWRRVIERAEEADRPDDDGPDAQDAPDDAALQYPDDTIQGGG